MRYGLSARAPTLAKMSQAFRSLVLQELYFPHPHPKVAHVLTELERSASSNEIGKVGCRA
jgi:hypothetical protein